MSGGDQDGPWGSDAQARRIAQGAQVVREK